VQRTSSPQYARLNKVVAVDVGERRPDGVIYDVFEILALFHCHTLGSPRAQNEREFNGTFTTFTPIDHRNEV
jgi:hypothetical protein